MSQRTPIYAISFNCWNDERNSVSFFRYDPRTPDGELSRMYRGFTCASIQRVQRLIGDGEALFLPDGRARINKRFRPSPSAQRQEAGQ